MTLEQFKALKLGDKVRTLPLSSPLISKLLGDSKVGVVSRLAPAPEGLNGSVFQVRVKFDFEFKWHNEMTDMLWFKYTEVDLVDDKPLPLPG